MYKEEMNSIHKLLYEFVNKCVLYRSKRRNEVTTLDLAVVEVLEKNMLFNLPSFMIKHMARIANLSKRNHALPYRFFITQVFAHFKVPLGEGKKGIKKKIFDRATLQVCVLMENKLGSKSNTLITQLINKLEAAMKENKRLAEEIASLKDENRKLKEKRQKVQEAIITLLDKFMGVYANSILFQQMIMVPSQFSVQIQSFLVSSPSFCSFYVLC